MATKNNLSLPGEKPAIAILGAGAVGLSAGYHLKDQGFDIDIFEQSAQPGGLAEGLLLSGGSIDRYYHHIFATDSDFLQLCRELNLNDQLIFRKTKTGHYLNGKIHDISSVTQILKTDLLNAWATIRFLAGGAAIKFTPKSLLPKNLAAFKLSKKFFGKKAATCIWDPLLRGKFGNHAGTIPSSWLISRIKDRSFKLGYFKNGFQIFYSRLSEVLSASPEISIQYNTKITHVGQSANNHKPTINGKPYDLVISTLSPFTNEKLLEKHDYTSKPWQSLGAACAIFELSFKPFNYYWVNLISSKQEISKNLAAISYAELDTDWCKENKSYPVYICRYCNAEELLQRSQQEWLVDMKKCLAEIIEAETGRQLNDSMIISETLSLASYAQPVISGDQTTELPPFPEKANHILFGNMHCIYPHDRGQNYAVKLGKDLATQAIQQFKQTPAK